MAAVDVQNIQKLADDAVQHKLIRDAEEILHPLTQRRVLLRRYDQPS
jgi:hypothetical protein